MANLSVQRKNMVESQVRPSDITDRRIPAAMLDVPREAFVPKARESLAYIDTDLPLGAGRVLLAPRTLAKLIQLLSPEPGDLVLDVGCATGYSAAILSRLATTVVALEADQALAQEATRVLQSLGVDNAAVVQGPLPAGYPDEGPFDRILVDGAVTEPPKILLGQLKEAGSLAAILISGQGAGRAVVWQKSGATYSMRDGFDATTAILPGFARSPGFVF